MFITNDIKYVGVNDHQVDLFEGQYLVPNGMSYNSYVIMDEKIAVMDTVDANFTQPWLENIHNALEVSGTATRTTSASSRGRSSVSICSTAPSTASGLQKSAGSAWQMMSATDWFSL